MPSSSPAPIPLPNRRATRQLAGWVGEQLAAGDLLILSGPLGSGKTFFARALCRKLGVPRERRVTSPTFALVHEHPGRMRIAHADLYRIENEQQLLQLGLDALRDDGHLLIVEWGEPYLETLGTDAVVFTLSLDPRRAELSSSGPRSAAILNAVLAKAGSLDASQTSG